MLAKNLCHAGRRLHHAVHLVDVAILTGDVGLNNLLSVDPAVGNRFRLVVGQDLQVAVSNLVVLHERGQEVNHGCCIFREEHGYSLPTRAQFVPVLRSWHRRHGHDVDRVVDAGSRQSAHGLAFFGGIAAHVRHERNEVGIVDHGIVQHELLSCFRHLLIRANAPLVGGIPLLERIVVSREERLRTCLAQHVCLPEVVNEAQHVGVLSFFLQPLVDRVAQPSRLSGEHFVVFILTRMQHAGTYQ